MKVCKYVPSNAFETGSAAAWLPKAAAEHGMYGTFISGLTGLFFVFGYDREFIENENFITFGPLLQPCSEFVEKKRLYWTAPDIIGRRFNIIAVGGSPQSLINVVAKMNALENVKSMSEALNEPMPEYFAYSDALFRRMNEIRRAYATTQNPVTRKRLLANLKALFMDRCMTTPCAAPEDAPHCTVMDYVCSPYHVNEDIEESRKWFKKGNKWESRLFNCTRDFADNVNLVGTYVTPEELGALTAAFEEYHIPYRVGRDGRLPDRHVMNQRQLTEDAGKPLGSDLVVFPTAYAPYLPTFKKWAVISICCTADEMMAGYDLLATGEYYLFCVNCHNDILRGFRQFGIHAYSNLMILGMAAWTDPEYAAFIAPLREKPIIDEIIMFGDAQTALTHYQGESSLMADYELRVPLKSGGYKIWTGLFGGGFMHRYASDDELIKKGVHKEEIRPMLMKEELDKITAEENAAAKKEEEEKNRAAERAQLSYELKLEEEMEWIVQEVERREEEERKAAERAQLSYELKLEEEMEWIVQEVERREEEERKKGGEV